MIITVTLNAAIDKSLSVPNFRLGRRHRTVEQTTMPGGKGVNVARVLKALGQPVIATGLAGGATGTRIVDQLTQLSVLSDFVRIREESRTNTAVIDPTTGEQTEINERGPAVSEPELELFVDKLLYLAKGAAVCVFSGSLPRGVPDELYARLIGDINRLGVLTVLDSECEALRLGIGLTNAAQRTTRGSGDLRRADFAGAAERLERMAADLQPAWIGFVGKGAYRGTFGERPELGEQARRLAETRLFVLPSTSPANAAVRYAERLKWFRELASRAKGS